MTGPPGTDKTRRETNIQEVRNGLKHGASTQEKAPEVLLARGLVLSVLTQKLLWHSAEGRRQTAEHYAPVLVSGTQTTSCLGLCLDPDLKKLFVKCHF